jgi:hypothetical protein
MRWIVLSDSRPAQLHALIESSARFMPYFIPDVLAKCDDLSCAEAYARVASRFHIHLYGCGGGWREPMGVLGKTRKNGATEAMTMLTTDTMVFIDKPNLEAAWGILKDANVLGVALTLAPSAGWNPTDGRLFSKQKPTVHTWLWKDHVGAWGDTFAYGTVYRTSDLLGPVLGNDWDSPDTLRKALCDDAGLRRRARMACLPSVCIDNHPIEDPTATYKYLSGEVVDLDMLAEDRTRYHWKAYHGQDVR